MSHGSSPASWSAVGICLLGFFVGAVGLVMPGLNWTVFTVGAVLTVVAFPIGKAMQMAGFGEDRH